MPATGANARIFVQNATTTSAVILAGEPSRQEVTFTNEGSADVYLTPNTAATATNGVPLEPGEELHDSATTGSWYVLAASGTQAVRVMVVS